MSVSTVLLLAFLIGVVCGLRSFTGPALICWGAELGWLNLTGLHLSYLGTSVAVIVFSLFAVGELAADKTSKIPPRTQLPSLIWRILMGALCGSALASTGKDSVIAGLVLGVLGALAGTYGGYYARRAATRPGRLPDLPVALCEDLIAVAGGLFLVSRF